MKKIALRLTAMIMLFGIFGFNTTSIAEATHPDVITVQYTDLTPQQKEAIQKGEPNYELLDGERIILVQITIKKCVNYQKQEQTLR